MIRQYLIFPLLAFFILTGLQCQSENKNRSPSQDAQVEVKTGADRLVEDDFRLLEGKNIGVITNHSAVVGDQHLVDVLHEAGNVNVEALFGPEHGIRGDAPAGEEITGGRTDERTGAPVYSLYGETRKPTPEMLQGLDALVFDIQAIGARFYTYISTMGLAMQAAAEHGVSFVVLDRPNPLGGERVEGFVLEPEHKSFVGYYSIPITHGLTVGELAMMVKGENMIEGVEDLDLQVVEMENWRRDMLWPDTNLDWIPPSPNIPNFETALIYPGACFFEGTTASEGRGTRDPFILLGAPWADGEALAADLNSRDLPGLRFENTTYTPESLPRMSPNPKYLGEEVSGIRYEITDPYTVRPVAAGIHVLHAFYTQASDTEKEDFFRRDRLSRLAGTRRLREMMESGASAKEIIASWGDELQEFNDLRRNYFLYD